MARTERKTSIGHKGFVVHSNPEVSLLEDVRRRDLTINAIAQDSKGLLLDYVGGVADINNKILRHVTDAFCEDPLRILRLARFLSKLHHLGFHVAADTKKLVASMLINQEDDIKSLSATRIFQETYKAMHTAQPHIYFDFLERLGALQLFMPAVAGAYAINKQLLQQAQELTESGLTRLAVLTINMTSQDLISLQGELNLSRAHSRHLSHTNLACQLLLEPLDADNILGFILRCGLKDQTKLASLANSLSVLIKLKIIAGKSLEILQQANFAINNLDNSWIKNSGYSSQQIKVEVNQQQQQVVAKLLRSYSK